MLSIRTQDRMALVPYNGRIMISIKDGKIGKKDWECDTLVLVTPDGVYKTLGTYATKERALEVLDEIEQHIVGKMFINENVPRYNFADGSPVYILEENQQLINLPSIYQMPKE